MNDPLWLSALWGRIGAGILIFAGLALNFFGYDFDTGDQGTTNQLVSMILEGLGGLLALWSKVRETKRVTAVPE